MTKTSFGPKNSDSKFIFKNTFTTICPNCKSTVEVPPSSSSCTNCQREIPLKITFIYQ